MRTKLKSLSKKYVHSYSDIGFGVLGRNEAVIALKQLINSFKTKKLLSSIDKIKPGKNPSESLSAFLDWMKGTYPSLYFRANEGKNYVGYTDADSMKKSILAFPLDFLPELGRMDRKLSNLALRVCYAFAGYHRIGEVYYGNRLYNEDWVIDGLHDTIKHGPSDPSESTRRAFEGYKETWRSYENDYPKYTNRFIRYSKYFPSVESVSDDLDSFICDYRLQFVVDALKSIVSLCWDKTISEYSNEAIQMFFEVNEYEKDSNGAWIVSDGEPVTLDDRIMLVWAGESSGGEDYVFFEIEAAANSFAGEFGYTEYSIDKELTKELRLDDLIIDYDHDKLFFTNLEETYVKFGKMRTEIIHGDLKNQIKNERQLQSSNNTESIQAGTLFEHVY